MRINVFEDFRRISYFDINSLYFVFQKAVKHFVKKWQKYNLIGCLGSKAKFKTQGHI